MTQSNTTIRYRYILLLLVTIFSFNINAKSKNSDEAKRLFDKVYALAFGPQGSHVKYSVNILGIYKTEGEIDYKGSKQRYIEARYCAWNDGKTAYMVDKKKKIVNVYRANDDDKDKLLSKFKYDVDNYDFSYKEVGGKYELTAKIKNSSFFGIKEVTAVISKTNYHPESLRIKLAVFRTTVKIHNFRSGGIDDNIFIFPAKKFQDYEFEEHRR